MFYFVVQLGELIYLGNFDDLIQSVKDKLWPLGRDIEFIPGHGPMSTFEAERQSNPFVSDAVLGLS